MARRHGVIAALGGMVLSVVASGCSDGRPDRVPVSGRVLIDGKPLDRGFIRFIPKSARASTGKIGKDGRFTLGCFEKADGAVPGSHAIEVAAIEVLNPEKVRHYVPEKYADAATSGLVKEITGPIDDLVVELTWDGGKPFTKTVVGGK
jgi:hypothetical protein